MGRIQHFDDDYYSSYYSYSPPSRKRSPSRKRKNKSRQRKRSDASRSPRRRREASRSTRKRVEISQSPRRRTEAKNFTNTAGTTPKTHPEPVPAACQSAQSAAPPQPGMGGTASAPGTAGVSTGFGVGGFNVDAGAVPSRMDFSRPARDMVSLKLDVPRKFISSLMTPEHQKILAEESGAVVEWAPAEAKVVLSGSAEQLERAKRLVARVNTHCCWGQSVEKVRRLLKPRRVESVLCRLSPMDTLPHFKKMLAAAHPMIAIGKGPENDLIIPNPHRVVSRQHCIVELDPERGAVYVHDVSTNGTFLNGVRLPAQQEGKVLLSHGDELLFKDPVTGVREFGYIVNLNEIGVKAEAKLEGYRRLISPTDGPSVMGRDLG
eukprot:TRINITY_DN73437_c0_g1_i1.p1 TRINITY_DN73437_c0_g1~~TRINITY_DN73437_c0_g1_i1.p1  ORF type:complete len:377 (-),score=41.04 TRINITY_DN73437_c0_g1_i1:398-1528(-)